VPGEYDDGLGCATTRPEIINLAKAHLLDFETEFLQAFNQDFLAPGIVWSERTAGDQGCCEI
jgi:hypothetical protein